MGRAFRLPSKIRRGGVVIPILSGNVIEQNRLNDQGDA